MLARVLTSDFELTALGRKIVKAFTGIYALAIVFMCFVPQNYLPQVKAFSTPGIIQFGRLYLLPVPFNSFVNARNVNSLADYFWILLQNAANIFLLFPLVLGFLFLYQTWRSYQKALLYSFYLSLTIECSQLILDLLIDAQRVFEIDDLWTNALGGLLAYCCYRWLRVTYVARNEID
ncbi:VanZ family protein [Streptococcus merionis]|uniref:VanZ family protein n=1 Tax=Streptococcus merionis TaxID=400065 RepID=UPI0026ED4ECB|nr:VanZ family protein [Streptococcus merionis]